MGRAFDHASFGRAFNGPDKQWVSYGTVDKDTKESPAVRFKDADGKTLPYGPMVNVTLQPSGISVACRISGLVAGNQEAEYFPFIAGDEVLVALPEGDERAGCVIIARLNQELDEFPTTVAGQDVTKNTFGFRRMRVPYVIETGESYLIRSAKTGSQIGIDPNGNVVINDGDQGSLLIGPEALSMSSGDGETFVTVLPPDKQVFLGADTASFLLDAAESKFISQGAISFATNGGSPLGHAVSAEQVVALLINVLAVLANGGSFTAGPLATGTYSAAPPTSCQTALATVLGPALSALAGVTPVGPAPGGSFLEFNATVPPIFGLAGALTAAMSNVLVPVDTTGGVLGYGKPGFKL